MNDHVGSLQKRLSRMGLDALLLNRSEVVSSVNLTYLSGFIGSDAALLITHQAVHLFTDGRYKTQAREEATGCQVHVVRGKVDALKRCLISSAVRRLGIEAGRVSYEFIHSLLRRVPQLDVVPLKRAMLENLRIHKSAREIEKIRAAADAASQSCARLLDSGIRGKQESEVAADLEMLFRRNRADGVAFETIVASGERSALPHGRATQKVIEQGELVVIDFGCRLQGYNSDETVTCIVGTPSPTQRKIYQAVRDAHDAALVKARPGVGVRDVDRAARHVIEQAGFGKYFLHGLGHGVGLEVHEPPQLSPRGRGVLEEGMVFTIEPGVYLEGVGGVRLESLVYLDRSGPELLSRMPKDLISVD